MCRPVPCTSCGKTTWAGCGMHVDQVKSGVPAGHWCQCSREESGKSSMKSLFGGLFGR